MNKDLVILQNITYKIANGKTLFAKLSCSLPSGITALIGDNGVGKSSLAQIILGEITNIEQGSVQKNIFLCYLQTI